VRASWNEANIQAVIGREQRTLAPCLREEAQRSPDWVGRIPIEFAIGNDGRVARLWIDEPRFKSGRLQECLLGALRRWRFEPFPGQQPNVTMTLGIGQ
jgi:outer membrane biosynthesis protein TonB